ncbi:MAG TPA: CapA family protein [Bacillota bacterium]|nr:CapA family protein [Bacillota bacterium]HPT86416.1 CapA family protein [Bacillota bacterium]
MRLALVIFLFLLMTITGWTAELPPASLEMSVHSPETLMAVGDIGFPKILGERILKDPSYPWKGTRDILEQADVLIGNLEIPLSLRGQAYTDKTWILRSHPQTVTALENMGFDIVTLANNHIMDFGPLALQDTIDALKSKNIQYTGAGMNSTEARKPAWYVTPNGVKIAFLAYSLTFPDIFWAGPNRPGTAHGIPTHFIPDIKRAKQSADIVVVSFHWSSEMLNYPKEYQKSYAKQCIDAGANLVIGHHPHVLQGLQVYQGGLIAYSLGNFAFGTYSTQGVKDSIILAVDFDRDGLIRAKLYPVNVDNHQVQFQTKRRFGKDAERVIQELRNFSKEFNTEIQFKEDIGIISIRN